MTTLRLNAAISCLLAAALFGASTPISKALLSSIGPLTLAGLLYLGAALGVAPFAIRGGSRELRREKRTCLLLAGAVISGGMIAPVALLLGLRSSLSASVSLWLNLETVATSLIAWIWFREHLGSRTGAAIAAIFAAGLMLAAPEKAAGFKAGSLVAVACVCWGFDNNLTALVGGFTPAQTTLVKGLVAGAVNLSLGLLIEGPTRAAGSLVPLALLVGALSYGISIMLYITGAQQLGASRSQLLFATSPFLGVVLAWVALHEPVLPIQLAAAALILVGLSVMLTARHEHEHSHESMFHTHSHRHDDGHHNHVHPGLPPWVRHTHPHQHEPLTHSHPHVPDLHHRHPHRGR